MSDSDSSGKILWFVAGAAIGVSAAMLLAPMAGADARKMIAEGTQKGRDAIAESGRDVFARGREMFEQGQKLIDEAAELFERGRRLVEGTTAAFQKKQA